MKMFNILFLIWTIIFIIDLFVAFKFRKVENFYDKGYKKKMILRGILNGLMLIIAITMTVVSIW